MFGETAEEKDLVLQAGNRPNLDYKWVFKLISPFKDADDLPPIQLEDVDGRTPENILPFRAKQLAKFIKNHKDQIKERVKLSPSYLGELETTAREATARFAETAAEWLSNAADNYELIFIREVPVSKIEITWQIETNFVNQI